MHRAIDISVGSLSPTINWGTLKTQEFLLPPKDQQAKLAELLWAMDAVVEKEMGVLERLDDLKGVLQRISFDKKDMDYIEISKIAKVYSGGTPNRKIPEFWNGDIPWIKTGEVNYQLITDTEERITQLGLQKSATRLFPKGSILVAMYGQGVTRGRVAISGISAACNQACAVIEVNKGQLPEFIYSYLEYKYEELRSLAHGANQQNLNLGMIKSFNFPNLNYEVQEKIVDELESINNSSSDLISQISTSKSLQKSLINQIF
jgi:type I restriction enzyme S subunit